MSLISSLICRTMFELMVSIPAALFIVKSESLMVSLKDIKYSAKLEEKKLLRDDDRFSLLLESFSSCTGNAQYDFCLVVITDIKPFLTLFQSEKPLAPFFFQKLKGLIVLILQRFVKVSVIRVASSNTFKLINLKLEENSLLPLHEIDVGLGVKSVLKKLTSQRRGNFAPMPKFSSLR